VKAGQVTTVNGLPAIMNNVTFNNVALDTYGNGASSVNIAINQEVTANLTSMIVRIGVYADLSNMRLYLPDGSEIPQGTPYSLNLVWGIDVGLPNGGGLPYIITGNTLYFIQNNSTVSLADMSLGDSYVEMQGSNQTAGHTAQVQFINSPQTLGITQTLGNNKNNNTVPGCLCLQTFPNLTYGVTTGVQSDPTIDANHPMEISLQTIIFIVAVVVIAIVAAVLFFRRRRSLRKKGIKTVNAETAAQK
jgi:hypothetical protein